MKTRNETCCITIVDHNAEYIMPKCKNVMIYHRWNGFDYHDVIVSAMSILTPDAPKLTDEQMFEIMKKHLFDESIHENRRLAMPHDCIDFTNDWVYVDIHEIIGKIDDLKLFAQIFADDIIDKLNHVGGDDSYYDYFPNYCDMFYCVCHELNLKQLYVDTYNTIYSDLSPYADDDEQTIAAWAD